MRTEYFKSDFDFILPFVMNGKSVGVPDCDWVARLYTYTKYTGYVVSCIGGRLQNCIIENGRVRAVMNNHGLGPGELKCALRIDIPDANYPDGVRSVAWEYGIDIVLSDSPDEVTAGVEDLPTVSGGVDLKSEKAAAAAAGVQRGMISLGAQPGVLYRNLGYISVKQPRTDPLYWHRDHAIDISMVDSELITGVWTQDVSDEFGISSSTDDEPLKSNGVEFALSADKKVLTTHVVNNGGDCLPVRLTVRPAYQYLMKFSDGVIRGVNLGSEPLERGTERRIEVKKWNGLNFYVDGEGLIGVLLLLGIESEPVKDDKIKFKRYYYVKGGERLRVDVEYKGMKRGKKHRHWTPNRSLMAMSQEFINGHPSCETRTTTRMGVARVRIAKTERRKAGPWTVFSYLYVDGMLYISPI